MFISGKESFVSRLGDRRAVSSQGSPSDRILPYGFSPFSSAFLSKVCPSASPDSTGNDLTGDCSPSPNSQKGSNPPPMDQFDRMLRGELRLRHKPAVPPRERGPVSAIVVPLTRQNLALHRALLSQ